MRETVIVDAVRSPVGRRRGGLAGLHANELLGDVLSSLLTRNGLSGAEVDQVIGGCVTQFGMQAANVTRNAWLTAGLPMQTPAVTVNAQCGSSQEATLIAHAQIAGNLCDVAVACGVEVMSAIGLGANIPADGSAGLPRGGRYVERWEPTTQFEGADRIAERWDISREEIDRFAKRSQDLGARAWAEDRFAGQIVPVKAPVFDDTGARTGTAMITSDEGLRETDLGKLATLKNNQPDRQPPSRHTAASTSQISDGASAVLLMAAEKAAELGLRPRARVVSAVFVGSDPELMLTGPIPATAALLERSGLRIEDIDLFEVNEAFASVVLAWAKEVGADLNKVNVNGGAIALGHPLGATGTLLITKALYELERTAGRYALVTMCCGGGLGTGTLIERLDPT